MAKLKNVCVEMYVGRECYDADAFMETTIGELVEACHSNSCPMGFFSCPLHCDSDCNKVTEKRWADFFHIKESRYEA